MAGREAEKMSKIDPEFEELVNSLPKPPPLEEVSFQQWRGMLAARKEKLNASGFLPSADTLIIDETTVTARDGHAIPVRTYRPKNPPTGGSPLVVFVHGGGFCLGDLNTEELNCRLFAAELGCAVVNPDYRLAPENPFPAGVLDCWDVLQWVSL